jgi:hypothetical protein
MIREGEKTVTCRVCEHERVVDADGWVEQCAWCGDKTHDLYDLENAED